MNAIAPPKQACGIPRRDGEARSVFPSPETIRLPGRTVRSLNLTEGQHLLVSASGGTAWTTMEGDVDDYTLTGASPFPVLFSGPGRLVIEAIEGDVLICIATPA